MLESFDNKIKFYAKHGAREVKALARIMMIRRYDQGVVKMLWVIGMLHNVMGSKWVYSFPNKYDTYHSYYKRLKG